MDDVLNSVILTLNNNPSSIKLNTEDLIERATTKELSIHEFKSIINETKDASLIKEFCSVFNHACIGFRLNEIKGKNNTTDMEELTLFSGWKNEESETSTIIHKALSDKIIKNKEYKNIKKEMFEYFTYGLNYLNNIY